jgi:3-hydroxyacyl-[acyl-carrier-protein] dehydratase
VRFLLVDRIVEVTPERARGIKHVAMTEDFLEHHFPGNPVMPGVLLVEALLQLAGWHTAVASGFADWLLLAAVQRSAFYGFVRPGDTVDLSVEPLGETAPGRRSYRGTASVGGARKVAVELTGEIVPLSQLDEPDRRRRLLATLQGPGAAL